jgi:hypothetical protein
MPTVPARASINQILPRDLHQSEGIVQLAIGQQAGVGGDIGAVELELQSAVEIEPRSVQFRFTRWVRHESAAVQCFIRGMRA